MDAFESSVNQRNTWPNYPTDCYPNAVEYYRPYGATRMYHIFA